MISAARLSRRYRRTGRCRRQSRAYQRAAGRSRKHARLAQPARRVVSFAHAATRADVATLMGMIDADAPPSRADRLLGGAGEPRIHREQPRRRRASQVQMLRPRRLYAASSHYYPPISAGRYDASRHAGITCFISGLRRLRISSAFASLMMSC